MKFGGPDPNQELFDSEYQDEWVEEAFGGHDYNDDEDDEIYYDDITGIELPRDLIKKARDEELKWVHDIKLYDNVPRQQAIDKGIKPISVRWVNVNKGDDQNMNVRCRLVGRELKAKTKEALLAHELFRAMPPWEMIKV